MPDILDFGENTPAENEQAIDPPGPKDHSEIYLTINGKAWDYWSSITLIESADSISRVSLTSLFDPDKQIFRDTFRPFSYPEMRIELGGVLRFVGTIMNVKPSVTPDQSIVTVEAYATCGILADVTPTPEQFPTEFKGMKLEQIAKQLCDPFNIDVVFGAPTGEVLDIDSGGSFLDIDALPKIDPGSLFEKIQLKPGQKILPLLIDLAKQRGLIIRSTPDGMLLFTRANPDTGDVVADLTSDRPVINISPSFEVQDYYSSMTGISKTKGGKVGSKFSVDNPKLSFVLDVLRPYVYEINDTDPADVPDAVTSRMGRMFADSISYNIDLATTVDQNGYYWQPDRYITLLAPKVMVYKTVPLLIRETKLTFTADETRASINVILPGVLSGEIPESLPWEE